jgi:hypothetical protein
MGFLMEDLPSKQIIENQSVPDKINGLPSVIWTGWSKLNVQLFVNFYFWKTTYKEF